MTVADRLLGWASRRGLNVRWGSGAKTGYGSFVVTGRDGVASYPFGISTDGKLDLYPNEMQRIPPFDLDDKRLDFIRRVAGVAEIPVEDKVANQSFKSFPLDKLSSAEIYGAVEAALDWFVEQARTGTARVRA